MKRYAVGGLIIVLTTILVLAAILGQPLPNIPGPSVAAPTAAGVHIELVPVREEEVPIPPTSDIGLPADPSTWCATPRRNEPFMRYAVSTRDVVDGFGPQTPGLPRSTIVFVHDEGACRRAALAFASVNGEPEAVPVMVIQVGARYLVTTPDFSLDPDAFWDVEIYDVEWNHIGAYSQGS